MAYLYRVAIVLGAWMICLNVSGILLDEYTHGANDGCVDKILNCDDYEVSDDGVCNSSLQRWASFNCPSYCNFCECYDDNATLCALLVKRYPSWCANFETFRQECRKSCNVCVDTYNPTEFIASLHATTTTTVPISTTTVAKTTLAATTVANATLAATTPAVSTKQPSSTTTTTTTPAPATLPPLVTKPCNKFGVIIDLAKHSLVTHPDAQACPDGSHSSSEAVVYTFCQAPADKRSWTHSISVIQECDRIPHYTPFATFDFDGNIAGVFIKCIPNGFQVAVQKCGESMQIIDITSNTTGFPPIDQYYIIDWK